MSPTQIVRNNIELQLKKLPERRLQEVLDFINFLIFTENTESTTFYDSNTKVCDREDYMSQFIGGVSHGSLAKNIDRELYGE